MVTPLKGDAASVPTSPAARKLIDAWDPAKDEAAGLQCKAYAPPPSCGCRVACTSRDRTTTPLKIETDAGQQTRLLRFTGEAPRGSAPSWQGQSSAPWEAALTSGFPTVNFGGGGRGPRSRTLEVTPRNLRAGYLRKNGVPYSEQTLVKEYFDRFEAGRDGMASRTLHRALSPNFLPFGNPAILQFEYACRGPMASLIEAIDIKRKMYFEFEGAPYHCLDVEISRPTARGGQTLVRLKMRNLLTRAVFDKTFKAGDKFNEPDLAQVSASYLYGDGDSYHFMDQDTFETLTLRAEVVGEDRLLLVDNVLVQIHRYNGNPIGLQFPPHVELAVTYTEPGVRGDTASGGVTKLATLETGLEIRVPLFVKEGDKVKVHTETREFAGRA